jgi:hypothetical protein
MVEKPSKRAVTVMEMLERILEILKDRTQHEYLQALLHNVDLETLSKYETKSDIPKWYLDLFIALTELYDKGYLDATKNSHLRR